MIIMDRQKINNAEKFLIKLIVLVNIRPASSARYKISILEVRNGI